MIVATTGLNEEHFKLLKQAGNNVPVIQSYNFSIGIQILLKLVGKTKELIPDWDIEIEELHHRYKRDKPSGTARMIQTLFVNESPNISSLRLGTTVGEHTVLLWRDGKRVIAIKHSATSKKNFCIWNSESN